MKAGTLGTVLSVFLAFLLQTSCGHPNNPDEGSAVRTGGGVVEAVEAINGIAAPPVPTETIQGARDAAAAANAHIETVDSILGSR